MRIRIRLLIRVMRICDHWYSASIVSVRPTALQGSILSQWSSWIVTSVRIRIRNTGPPWFGAPESGWGKMKLFFHMSFKCTQLLQIEISTGRVRRVPYLWFTLGKFIFHFNLLKEKVWKKEEKKFENLDPDLYPEMDSALKPIRIPNVAYTYFLN